MKDHLRICSRVALLLGTCSLAVAVSGVVAGSAHATGTPTPAAGGSASYQCKDRNDTQAAPTPVTFSLISPPASVRPGDTLALSGNLGITLAETDRQESQLLLANNASIAATDFDLVVTFAGRTVDLKPTSVISTPARITSPFTLTADVSYPDLDIPASATGAVTVTMPSAEDAAATLVGAPAKVTFTSQVKQDSPLMPTRDYACWTDDLGSHATIARVPLTTSSGSGTSASSGPVSDTDPPASGGMPAPAAQPAGTSQPDVAGSAPLDPSPAPDIASAAPGDAPSPVSSPGDITQTSELASAPIPSPTVSHQTFVPGWILALFIAVFPAAAVAYAVVQRRRLKAITSPPAP
ncbi:hypothetical protein [Nocardioides ultimimeridianus]